MVSKKRRRRELARASARRQAVRRAQRLARRRRLRVVATIVLVALAVSGLAVWAKLHGSGHATARAGAVDYHSLHVDHKPMPKVEVLR